MSPPFRSLRKGRIDARRRQAVVRATLLPLTVKTPGRRGAYDGAATTTGTAKQLVNALQQGLLTEAEYEQLRTRRRAS